MATAHCIETINQKQFFSTSRRLNHLSIDASGAVRNDSQDLSTQTWSVTNNYPGGFWADYRYDWFSGS
jgi:hypothetical protein